MCDVDPVPGVAVFYLSLAVVGLFGSSLIGVNLLPAFAALRWVRIHFITLGVLTQAVFAALPWLVAQRTGQPAPKTQWSTWLIYNAGILALLVGIPLVNTAMILAGGTLVLVATTMLAWQIRGLARARPGRCAVQARFYGAGLLYLLLGAFVGTGLWLGWSTWLHLPAPKEVHIHSNLWGFASLVMAGLLLELRARLIPDRAPGTRSITAAFWLIVVGALGLITGPWLQSRFLDAAGVTLHTAGTLLILIGVARALKAEGKLWKPGSLQLLSPYLWFLVAVVLSPVVVFAGSSSLAATIEDEAPLLLVYGWLLPFILALLPYLLESRFLPGRTAALGGT